MPLTPIQLSPTVTVAGASGTLTATLPGNTGTGNTLVACITTTGGTTCPTVSGLTLGGAAGNWQAAYSDPTTAGFTGYVWYDPGAASGQTSVVLTFAGGAGTAMEVYLVVYEVPGVLTFDKGSHGDSASSPAATWSSGATATTSQANEIFFGAATSTLEVPTVTGAGTWTTQSTGAGTYDQAAGYQVVSSTGTATFSGTFAASGRAYAAVVATFYVASTTGALAGAGSAASGAVIGVTAALAGAGSARATAAIGVTAALAGAGLATSRAAIGVTAALAGTGSATAARAGFIPAALRTP